MLRDYSISDSQKTVARDFKFTFSILHKAPRLKMLSFYFNTSCSGPHFADPLSYKWNIVEALGMNIEHLPGLQSLKTFGWFETDGLISLFDKAKIAQLTTSLRHLSFSLPADISGIEDSMSREPLEKQAVVVRSVQNMVKPAVNLESLTIEGAGWGVKLCLDIPQTLSATYPRLAALSLKCIVWGDGTIGHGGILMPPPLEDFITHHRETLKILKLIGCSILVEDYGRKLPICYWADVYKRLADAMTELVELEVVFDEGNKTRYHSSTGPPNTFHIHSSWNYHCLERLEGSGRDTEALEEFKAVVKRRAMNTGSCFNPEGKGLGWSEWDEKLVEWDVPYDEEHGEYYSRRPYKAYLPTL